MDFVFVAIVVAIVIAIAIVIVIASTALMAGLSPVVFFSSIAPSMEERKKKLFS